MDHATAVKFFADLFDGEHHIPGGPDAVKPWGGTGWIVSVYACTFATVDPNRLTRLVLMCHDRCIRAELVNGGPNRVRIAIWQRGTREGSSMVKHPTMEEALATWREAHPS